ncbi:MAG TPA: hypothetical protein DEP45_11035 [Armatimonadetes bacterium]|nr:hypothetical protein [Armatimonadota bacterium]
MSRAVAVVLLATLVMAGIASVPRPADAQGVYVELSIPRVEERGRVLIQMREIFEWLGWAVEWDPWERAITAYDEDYTMTMWVNNYQAIVNGEGYALDVPPRLLYNKTFVPLRFVAEVTDCQVDYLGNAVQVTDIDGSVLMVYLQ